MAKNGPRGGGRKGAVTNRTQLKHPGNGHAMKRDRTTGQFIAVKKTPGPYKGVAKEPDGRQD